MEFQKEIILGLFLGKIKEFIHWKMCKRQGISWYNQRTTVGLVWLGDGREYRGRARGEVVQEGRSHFKSFDKVTWIIGSHKKVSHC